MTLSTIQETILQWLGRYKYLCLVQIHQHFYPTKTYRNAEIMVQRLEKAGLIHRIKAPRSANFNFGVICYLSKAGFEFLKAHEHNTDFRLIHGPVKNPISSLNHYYHRKRLVDFHIALDKSVARISKISLKSVALESQQIKSGCKRIVATNFSDGDLSIVPDMAFVLKGKGGLEAAYMVEVDTARESIGGLLDVTPKGSLMEKCKAYESLLSKKIWKERLNTTAKAFQVLIVTEKSLHAKTIVERIKKQCKYPEYFLVSTHGLVEKNDVLRGRIWCNTSQILIKVV